MSVFLKWYMVKLRTHPLLTNSGSALVLMSSGDCMAQHIEKKSNDNNTGVFTIIANTAQLVEQAPRPEAFYDVVVRTYRDTREGMTNSLDLYRTATMAAWATLAYTPFYLGLYNLFDRYLPTRNTIGIASRVGLSFMASIPVNAAFYCYGSLVHHVTDYAEQVQCESNNSTMYDAVRTVPLNLQNVIGTAKQKLEQELWNTIVASGCVWIPINMVNFSVVRPHLRPLTLMVCSVGWNCYLSLAQHRSVE